MLAKYVAEITEHVLENLRDQRYDLAEQIEFANKPVCTVLQAA